MEASHHSVPELVQIVVPTLASFWDSTNLLVAKTLNRDRGLCDAIHLNAPSGALD